jgi:hypothetical protein
MQANIIKLIRIIGYEHANYNELIYERVHSLLIWPR